MVTRTVTIQGVEFELDQIVDAHLQRGYTGGILDLSTADGVHHTFELWIRDSAADHRAYVVLKYESGCYTETWPSWRGIRAAAPAPVPEATPDADPDRVAAPDSEADLSG
ncbi:hypothetical protein ACIRP0_06705 [Streptomyces sp. NPDC101733]|uniref:hypothetical protein n=1 Tax=unclassified Streptomyces TaxID=2593676 RepID=UPI0038257887